VSLLFRGVSSGSCFFYRKPKPNNFSVGITFQTIRESVAADEECVVAESRFDSRATRLGYLFLQVISSLCLKYPATQLA
jgi:hypothetical protein